jgi:glucosamine kinase
MRESLFIGVDGGATKCIVRVEDETGQMLGREVSGPANIRLSVSQAWGSIHSALEKILNQLNIKLGDPAYHWYAGMGLAGCELSSAYESFLGVKHSFDKLVISSDAHTACLGAHAGKDGAVIIVGTGAVGFQLVANQATKVGGWGFPQDDEGGGASLGLQAVKVTLQALDGRMPLSSLASLIYARFENNLEQFVSWTNQANSTAFAGLAPMVIQQCQAGDPVAVKIMQEAVNAVNHLGDTLHAAQPDQTTILPCSLIGGIAPFMQPLLSDRLRARLAPSQLTPDAGAILLVRDYLSKGGK